MIDNATYSKLGFAALKATPPTFTNLKFDPSTVDVASEGDWNEEGACDDKHYSFENGHLVLTGDVWVDASGKLPAKGHYLTDGNTKHWMVEASSVTEFFACKPCKGSLTLKWSEQFQAAVTSGDLTIDNMASPPLTALFTVPS